MKKTLTDDQILEKFMATVQVEGNNTKEFFILTFLGLPGSGKSTVAYTLAKRLNLYVCSGDEIRRFLNRHGLRGIVPKPALDYRIAKARTDLMLSKRVSHVIDGDIIRFINEIRERAAKVGAKVYVISIECPDEILLQRLEKRKESKDLAETHFSKGAPCNLPTRKKMHQTLPRPDNILHTVDSTCELEPQIEAIIDKLKKEGVI
jgi:dephospho-CoA kinase